MKNNLAQRDRSLLWHPFTQEKTADLPINIIRGTGAYLYDEQGKRYLDLISSWWVNIHGHAHPKIARAIYQQALKLEQVIFAGFTHQPAVELCEKLQTLLPNSLARFFFSDNGSTAVEVALKMAYQFWYNQGEKNRTTFIAFDGAYHGDTFGAMSTGQGSHFHDPFQNFFFNVAIIPFPATWDGDDLIDQKESEALLALEKYLNLNKHKKNTAALIVEPLIQGASGMRICRPEFLRKVIDLVRAHEILIIFDEVMTGFGRTGTLFALEQVQRVPDLLCLAKGLSGGFLPLALTIASEKIYMQFLSKHFNSAFAHGHSYTANPLGCAAALASLALLNTSTTQKKIQAITKIHQEYLPELAKNVPSTIAPRHLGTIAAFNLQQPETNYLYLQNHKLKQLFLERGLLIRPLGNTIYLLPPYCITAEELTKAYETITEVCQNLV